MNVLAGLPAPAPTSDGAAPDAAPTDAAAAPTDGAPAAAGPLEAIIAAILAGADAKAASAPTAAPIEAGTTADADVPADESTDDSVDGGVVPAAPAGAMPAALVAALLGGAQAVAATPATPSSPDPSLPGTAAAAAATAPSGPVVSPTAPSSALDSPIPSDPATVPGNYVPSTPEPPPADGASATTTVPANSVTEVRDQRPADGVPSVTTAAEGPVTEAAVESTEPVPTGTDPTTATDSTSTTDGDATTRPAVTLGPDPVLRHLDGQAAAPRPGVTPLAAATRAEATTAAHHVELPMTDPNVARIGGLVRTMAHGEVRSATLTLNPAELGEVRVELRSQDGVVSVHLSASHPEGLEALRNSTGSLRRELERAGLGLDRVDVGFSGDSPGQSARQGTDERGAAELDLGPAQSLRPFTPTTRLSRPTRPIPIRGETGLDLDL